MKRPRKRRSSKMPGLSKRATILLWKTRNRMKAEAPLETQVKIVKGPMTVKTVVRSPLQTMSVKMSMPVDEKKNVKPSGKCGGLDFA